jgi:plastocyanin
MRACTGKAAALATLSYLTIVFATACGGSDVDQPEATSPAETTTATTALTTPRAEAPPPAQAGPPTITIDDFVFNDFNSLTVKAGAQVTVKNNDADPHTVTSNTPGAFNIDVAARSEATFTAPSRPGSYPFHCNHHSSMHGTLIVQ